MKRYLTDKNKKLLLIGIEIICALACFFYLRRVFTNMGRHSGTYLNIYILVLILASLCVLYFVYSFFRKIKTERMFLVIAGLFGTILMILLPIRVAPDETKHAMTSYKISDWILQVNQPSDDFFYMRQCDVDMFANDWNLEWDPSLRSYEEYFEKAVAVNENTELVRMDLSMGLDASELAYVFSSLGITVGRVLCCNAFTTLMLGRIFNFMMYLLMVYYAIKIIPIGKQLMATISLFPVALQQGMSYSYDSPIIASCLFLTACSIHFYYQGLDGMKHKKLFCGIWLLLALFIVFVKSHAYIFVSLLSLIAILKHFGLLNKTVMKWIYRILMGIVVLISTICLWDKLVGFPQILVEDPNAEIYSFAWVINRPYQTLGIYINTFIQLGSFYYTTMISAALGWLNLMMPFKVLFVYSCILVFNLLKREDEKYEVDGILRFFSFGACLITLLAIMLGLLVGWTPMGQGTVGGVQGRYLIPVVFLLLISFRINKISIPNKFDVLCNAGMICGLLSVINMLLNRF